MEALRKAEEAKRQAAQKEKAGMLQAQEMAQQEVQPTFQEGGQEPVPHSELLAEPAEPLLDPDTPALQFDTTPSDQSSMEHDRLDVEFDFKIDEDFDLEPRPAEQDESHQTLELSVNEETPVPPARGDEPEDSHSLNFEPTETLVEEEIFPSVAAAEIATVDDRPPLELSLAASEPVAVTTRPDDSEPVPASTHETERETPQNIPKQTRRATESVRRQSAQAVFNAKSAARKDDRGRRLMLIAAVLMLLPLGGGVYLLLQEMGILSTSSPYNIPTASFDSANIQWPEPTEIGVEQETLVDIVQDSIDAGTEVTEPVVAIADAAIQTSIAAISVNSLTTEPVETPSAVTALPQQTVGTDFATKIVEDVPFAVVQSDPTTASAQPALAIAPPVERSMPLPAAAFSVPNSTAGSLQGAVSVEENRPTPSISITRSEVALQVDPQLTLAYAAYQMQDFIRARAHYQQALRNEPRNRDAMLGMAAVAMQLGETALARDTYARLLQYDPRDALARVGLLQITPASDAVGLESELKALFETQSDMAPLAFALGNLYASQRRWNEAQQSYYDALLAAKASGGPVSPDYAFNLAVSLERLNQPRPALGFYNEALELSRITEPGFDMAVLFQRIDAITRVLP